MSAGLAAGREQKAPGKASLSRLVSGLGHSGPVALPVPLPASEGPALPTQDAATGRFQSQCWGVGDASSVEEPARSRHKSAHPFEVMVLGFTWEIWPSLADVLRREQRPRRAPQ